MENKEEYLQLDKTTLVDTIETQQKLVDALEVKVHMLNGNLEDERNLTDAFSQYMQALDDLLNNEDIDAKTRLSAAQRLVKWTRPKEQQSNV